jgi:hypothetical protein
MTRKLSFAVAVLTLQAWAASAATIRFVPQNQTVLLGDVAEVHIVIDGLSLPDHPLGAWNLEFSYNPGILTFLTPVDYNTVELGDPDGSLPGSFVSTLEPSTGVLNLDQVSFLLSSELSGQPSSFRLATVRFRATSLGVSPLIMNPSVNALSDADGFEIPVSSLNGSIAVAAVPEPKLALPCAACLALLSLLKRRRSTPARQK